MEYTYFKFVGGKYFRANLEKETFQVINNDNHWENDTSIWFLFNDLGIDYEEITDSAKLEELKKIEEERGMKK